MSIDMDLPEPVGYLPACGLEHLKNGVGPIGVWPVQSCNVLEPVFTADQMRAVIAERDGCRHALFQAQEAAKLLLAKGEMLAAVVQGAKEEFVRVPYGASHEDVAAINDWHKMASEALAEWENKA